MMSKPQHASGVQVTLFRLHPLTLPVNSLFPPLTTAHQKQTPCLAARAKTVSKDGYSTHVISVKPFMDLGQGC